MNTDDPALLRARIRELEVLCAEVYVAAVELGLPEPLLNRLWTIAAQGRSPDAFEVVNMPPRAPMPQKVSAGPSPVVAAPVARRTEPAHLPDIRLTDRAREAGAHRHVQPELKPLATRRAVLVVDDDPTMLEVLVRILQRENYELLTACSGPDALRQAEQHAGEIDLLVTDYAMPDMKGRELADKMRERYRGLKVLYQTGFSDMLFEDRAELEDGTAFLEKPFTARGLREAVRFILFGSINPV